MRKMIFLNLVILFVVAFLPMFVFKAAAQTLECEIEFTYVPPFGNFNNLQGLVSCVNPVDYDDYKVAVYICVPPYGWWIKPSSSQPLTTINSDGTWICDITTGGQDECATQIIAFLVPNGFDPPLGSGQQCLPSELYQYPYAEAIRYEKIGFAGYDWWVKRSCDPVGPGPNYFEDNAWVDSAGYLHLKIERRDGDWYCSEVIADESLGYGTYVFTVRGRVDLLDENIVLGLFTWEDCMPEHNYREIDIELSRWGAPSNDNAQFVVQPWNTPGNLYRFNIDLAGYVHETTTHVLSWQPGSIRFWSYYGDPSSVVRTEDIIACWHYTGNDVPPAGGENPRINFWLMGGNAPNNGQDAEIVIKNFQHLYNVTIQAAIDMDPDTLNLANKGKWITCYIRLGGCCEVADIDYSSILLDGEIEADSLRFDAEEQVAIAKFSRAEVQRMLLKIDQTSNMELTVSGALRDGTRFEGTDTIRIIDPKNR